MPRMAMREAGLLCFLLVLLGVAGCERGPAPLVSVAGRVTYKGASLPGGTIVFTPDVSHGETGAIVHGKIDSEGRYQLAGNSSPGIAPGWYRITVTCLAPATSPPPGERFAIPSSLIPEKYRDPQLSHLSCEVKAGRANTINFDLE